ncbi:sensor histidine kinase [Marinifilum sp. D714]|uniref:sensor histidine kinase n=1 Tax=Marinifilum sp. D714 TaxID=2937523 RepID=UPI0027BD6649|nr:sensor histidine kinase [Marinifilum sp. D714]MDQ2180141.1 sensor histidine kinase [Marinifilum sp. D714]
MNRRFFVKQKIALILIGFSLVAIAAILYVLDRSSDLDNEHIALVENSEKIETKVYDIRIKYGDYQEDANSALSFAIDSLFTKVYQNIENIQNIASRKFEFNTSENSNFMIALMEVKSTILDFDSIVRNDQVPSQDKNLKQSVSAFAKTFADYEKALHLYIYQTNQKFKRNIFILLAFILILLLGSLFLVIRLMNSLTNAHLQLVRNTMTVEQRERKRIARELHDGLGALLSSIGLYGKMLGKELTENKTSLDKVQQINQLSKQALVTVSEVINNLNPSVLNRYNLQESLQRLVDKINNLDNVDVTLQMDEFKGKPLQSTQVVIYRICSELINNTLKHAKATDIQIKLSGEGILVLRYSDNGVGFDFDRMKAKDGKGMGLQNIIERVESINGSYNVQTSQNKGFKIKIQFTLSKSKQK